MKYGAGIDLGLFENHRVRGIEVLPGSKIIVDSIDLLENRRVKLKNMSFYRTLTKESMRSEITVLFDYQLRSLSFVGKVGEYFSCGYDESGCTSPKRLDSNKLDDSVIYEPSEPVYDRLTSLGNEYISSFRVIDKYAYHNDCFRYKFRGASPEPIDRAVLLDGIFQGCLFYIFEITNNRIPMVLSTIESLEIHSDLEIIDHCIITRTEKKYEKYFFDIYAVDSKGFIVVDIKNLSFGKAKINFSKPNIISTYADFTLDPVLGPFEAISEETQIAVEVENNNYRPWRYLFSQKQNNLLKSLNCLLIQPKEVLLDRMSVAANRETRFLPNGIEISEINSYESDYLYKEIFIDKCYARHGIHLNKSDTVIDIGANIGMFSLWALQAEPGISLHCFEPSPQVGEVLVNNLSGRGKTTIINKGVFDNNGIEQFTYYPNSSVFSGFSTGEVDKKNIESVIGRMVNDQNINDPAYEKELTQSLTNSRFDKVEYSCEVINLSGYIKKQSIGEVGLLKIDAEKSEIPILKSLSDDEYKKIRQIVVEVHEQQGGELEVVCDLLHQKNYALYVDKENELSGSTLFTVTAVRPNDRYSSSSLLERCNSKEDVHQLLRYLEEYDRTCSAPLSVVLCPNDGGYPDIDPSCLSGLLKEACEGYKNIHFKSLSNDHRIEGDVLSLNTPDEALIPFKDQWYNLLAIEIHRELLSIVRSPTKVVVVDADNTLWKGVCAESDIEHLIIDRYYKMFHKLLKEMSKKGVLLCIASKNIESDVFSVLANHPDSILKPSDFIDWEINWNRKSHSIDRISRRLNLGSDSFVFIDDNPVECDSVRRDRPSVCVIQLEYQDLKSGSFFNDNWALDKFWNTEEDAVRNKSYLDEAERKKLETRCSSLLEYLEHLQVQTHIKPLDSKDINRAKQLFLRTNQFNFSQTSYSDQDIVNFLRGDDNRQAWKISVSDRYGDYGVVGMIVLKKSIKYFEIENVVLSCRILGRGVEYDVFNWVGRYCLDNNTDTVLVKWKKTSRNIPAINCLFELSENHSPFYEDEGRLKISRSSLLSYRMKEESEEDKGDMLLTYSTLNRNANISVAEVNRIGKEVEKVVMSIGVNEESYKQSKLQFFNNMIERDVFSIFDVVTKGKVRALSSDLFSVGGTSLNLINILGKVYSQFGIKIDLSEAYRDPSPMGFCNLLKNKEPDLYIDKKENENIDLQKGIWFGYLLNPTTHDFNVPVRINLKSRNNINPTVLKNAMHLLVLEAPSLRARFTQSGRETLVDFEDEILLHYEAKTFRSSRDLEDEVKSASRRPINLRTGPISRMHVLELKDRPEMTVLMVFHHIVVDLFSVELIASRLEKNIRRIEDCPNWEEILYCKKKPTVKMSLRSSVEDGSISFWRDKFSFSDPLNIPVVEKGFKRSLDGRGVTLKIDSRIANKIVLTASKYSVSANMLMLSFYVYYLLSSYADRGLAVGIPISKRGVDHSEEIGNFTDIMPLCFEKTSFVNLKLWLERVKSEFNVSVDNFNLCFSDLVKEIPDKVGPSRSPLVQTTFLLQEASTNPEVLYVLSDGHESGRFSLANEDATFQGVIQQCAQVDIAVEVLSTPRDWLLSVKYDSHLVTYDFALQFLQGYSVAIEELLDVEFGKETQEVVV